MSLGGALNALVTGLESLFDPSKVRKLEQGEPQIRGIQDAAGVWARAVLNWASGAGFAVTPPNKDLLFQAALVNAWATVPPQGPVLTGQAFSVFWTGNFFGITAATFTPAPFLPILPPPPLGATPRQQAQQLAQTVYIYTLSNGVLPPGSPFPP